ncbi:sensor histidine kinase [Guyparkeria sp. SCN-R1]|uniref:sensor histidine kinase n=1 Tax=Guyparkeria sp. SCN-R1 TaxID=2341113 RepID=UPI000F6462ED|nr:HAMP domain-containing sensor histidine kinase [Guyparkeria sp. SCN-R1]RRQ20225.1 sensor histidine kinase [Guyparkeria sp. SCN-R1]
MKNLAPFPYIYYEKKYDGILFDWPEQCKKCQHHACHNALEDDTLYLCSYGFNYIKINKNFTISGFLAKDAIQTSPARQKNMGIHRRRIVQNQNLSVAIDNLKSISIEEQTEIENKKLEVVQEYIKSNQYKDDFMDCVREEINKGLSFVHDYKQINAQIAQNINVIIEKNYKHETLEEKVSAASHQEKAIYWASKFLTEKLNVAKFLLKPDWITKESEKDSFRFHGLFLKYLRIYQHMYDKRGINVTLSGESFKHLYANPEALGVIVHTFLDNALKYSKAGSNVRIHVSDEAEGIFFSVLSYGPKIKETELQKIFQPFFRGENAIKAQEEGAGYGLYIAQMVAKKIGTEITVEQEDFDSNRGHETTFNVLLPD